MNLISVPDDISSKDQPLREDVRLLGRIFGETLRDQEGEEYFQLIESVRKAAVRFRKTQDERDGATLYRMLAISIDCSDLRRMVVKIAP